MDIEPAQCRAARGMLNWSQTELGQRARVSQKTIAQFELGKWEARPATIEVLKRAFENAGIAFLDSGNGLAFGVGLKEGYEMRIEQGKGEEPAKRKRGAHVAAVVRSIRKRKPAPTATRNLPVHIVKSTKGKPYDGHA